MRGGEKMLTKKGFGGILKGGAKCNLIKADKNNGNCVIQFSSGMICHGNLKDLEFDTIEYWPDFLALKQFDLLDFYR